ncbi:MAG: hypothetical protein EDS66_05130 [Planctomycetota bacterium]|nr:MAG: hypothetical protein EDS66_05130 [Planctomycetota bacterium]MCQ3921155.1 hypothetical protein [Planctomycetota bacterium]
MLNHKTERTRRDEEARLFKACCVFSCESVRIVDLNLIQLYMAIMAYKDDLIPMGVPALRMMFR